MPIPELDFDMSETERAVKETVHKFAAEVMRPAGEKLDKLPADEVIAKNSIFWDVHKQYVALGLDEVDPDMSPLEQARLQWTVGEEMGWGDSGLAIAFGAGGMPSALAAMAGREDLQEKFPPNVLGCWAITEPDHGSDMIDFDDAIIDPRGKRGKPNTVARADGNEYVISGQKAAWVSNGTIAKCSALLCHRRRRRTRRWRCLPCAAGRPRGCHQGQAAR